MCINCLSVIFSTIFVRNTFPLHKYVYGGVCVCSRELRSQDGGKNAPGLHAISYCCPILTKIGMCQQNKLHQI